jgi:hypothetical protein
MRMISRKFAKDRDLVTNYEVRPNIYANIFTDFGEKNLTLLNEFFSAGSQYLITPTLDVECTVFWVKKKNPAARDRALGMER